MAYTMKTPVEGQIRQRLGIPEGAEVVLVFAESSHWDPNWVLTSEEYFERFVRRNLDQALDALRQEPRRVYSVECLFFLRQYWESCPEVQGTVRELVNNGQLRLTSSGVTTADTILPSAEAVLRDLLIGQEWLRVNDLRQEPTLAYFTDSFGCTPALPSLLQAAGFDCTALTRVDGMYFLGCDLEPPWRFPRTGSTAELLLKQERSLDFLWRDDNGAQVLCHWNAFSYGQGDMLAFLGISRVYLARFALPLRADWYIARRIKQYVAQLSPLSRTPYLLCPIGFDFVEPIPDLVALLDRYNRRHYPRTGVWAVNAGLDDYFDLVAQHRQRLPVLELDPNPYWSGFYTARPTLKQRCRHLVDDLLLAEKLSFLPENQGAAETLVESLADPWWQAAVSNHHDFITGTSPDRVVEQEQIPWLEEAAGKVKAVLKHLAPEPETKGKHLPDSEPQEGTTPSRIPAWHREGGRVRVETAHYQVVLSERVGGGIVLLHTPGGESPRLESVSNDLVSYRDSGGLWRMGFEFLGGTWRESSRASRTQGEMRVEETHQGLLVRDEVHLDGETFQRKLWFRGDSPLVFGAVEGRAAAGRSVTVRFETGLQFETLVMNTAGGTVTRPLQCYYQPTFWPLYGFAHLLDQETGRGLAVFQPLPGAISIQPGGQVELVAARNATREKVLGLVGIPANPASGHETESYTFRYALMFTEKGGWRENDLGIFYRQVAREYPADTPSRARALSALADSLVTTDSPEVWVAAVKPAWRGEGVIVRLNTLAIPDGDVRVTASHFEIRAAYLCDARERDLGPLAVVEGGVRLRMPGSIATIRLVMG